LWFAAGVHHEGFDYQCPCFLGSYLVRALAEQEDSVGTQAWLNSNLSPLKQRPISKSYPVVCRTKTHV